MWNFYYHSVTRHLPFIKPAVRQLSRVKSINFDVENIVIIFRLDEIIEYYKSILYISVNVYLSITVSNNDSLIY